MFRFEKVQAALNDNYLLPNPDKSMFHFMVQLPLFQFIQVYKDQHLQKQKFWWLFAIGFFCCFDNSKGCS